MSGINKICSSCKKNIDINDFQSESKTYSTCITCRNRKSEKRRKNICEDCGIRANFNYENIKFGIRCLKHKKIGMIDIKHKTCEIENCKKRPSFNNEGESKARFCVEHKEVQMVNVVDKTCEYINCKKRPSFNFEGKTKARFCVDHKEVQMIDVKNKRCEQESCDKIPHFNFEGESKGRFCVNHKKIQMIDVVNKKCNHIGCQKQPHFNFEGESNGRFCSEHKENEMININRKTCEYINCKKIPVYNKEGESKGRFCTEHKENGMINVKDKTCEYINCKKIPHFNFKGESKARFCSEHKEVQMIDVKNKRCEQETCKSSASFGYINQIPTRCARHKLPLMFKNRKVECQEENCKEISEYGKDEPNHCYLHKKDDELCLLGQTCKNCGRENELCNSEQICLTYCRPVELSINAKKIIKKKECLVLSYLDKNITTDIKPIDDRIIDNSCVKRRPDRVYDCGSFFVIVEVDENQHSGYTNGCSFDKITQENRRMCQIHEALSNGMMPVIFLRFNPDNFKVNGKLQKVNMQKRLDVLCKWVLHCLNLKHELNTPSIRIKHLFYDDYEETNSEFMEFNDNDIKNMTRV
jgi:hypothetical protein